ncbi:MAG: hypothetical protein FJ102_14095 [Deltaproteobacteria bacterium]|nr:hypothetical protein [Deltaproteobacteria bacterium]
MADNKNLEQMSELLGKLWTRTQKEASRAGRAARDMLHLRQLRGDRERMFVKLGKETRQLIEAGEIKHPGLERGVHRIDDIERQIREQEAAMRSRGVEPETEAQSEAASAAGQAGDEG